MRVVIPWSGGLDSTALICKTLKEGHAVRTFACDFDVMPVVNEMQARARGAIRTLLWESYPNADWLHFGGTHTIKISKCPHEGFTQVLPTLLAALHHVNFEVETQIWLGYVATDPVVKTHGEVLPFNLREATMGMLQLMLARDMFEKAEKNLKVFAPFAGMQKTEVIEWIPEAISPLCWSCSEPLTGYRAKSYTVETCDRCIGCADDPRDTT